MQVINFPETILKGGTRGDDGLDDIRKKAYETAVEGRVRNLLSVGKDAKTVKGEPYGVRTAVMYLAPASISGYEVCPSRTKGCSAACLFTAGQGRFANVKQGRIRRTLQFKLRREEFFETLLKEIDKYYEKAQQDGMEFAVRLNGTSDIDWENYPVTWKGKVYANIFEANPYKQFYDYTKRIERLARIVEIPNYHITFSRAESKKSQMDASLALEMGVNVTVVFRSDIPATWKDPVTGLEYKVVDGDKHDIRFYDQKDDNGMPVVIGLTVKGTEGEKDTSGFVVD